MEAGTGSLGLEKAPISSLEGCGDVESPFASVYALDRAFTTLMMLGICQLNA